MSPILNKKEMTEEDIKFNCISPSLVSAGWQDNITMETKVKFTDGKINIKGNKPTRDDPLRADYILYINRNNPIAIVEAKDNNHTVSYGLQQAMTYAEMMDIPFAYSSNGDAFYEHDFLTGKEREIKLENFPKFNELIDRFKAEQNNGSGLSKDEESLIYQDYYTDQNTFKPRYYQRNAINRTLNAIAKGKNRLLLVMATGTGKTYTAFQIVYRLLKSGLKKKVLYLADRNILVDQSIQQDFSPLSKTIHKINFKKDDSTTISSYEVYFSLYQQLSNSGDNESTLSKLEKLFKPDFFDFIIVDECHRGSAKNDSNWRKILDYFTSATQLGMTATPKETSEISNIDYFGKPIYTYSLKQGIEDGFLAPFKVINITTDISDGWRPTKDQKDINGNIIEDRIYTNSDFDYNIVLEGRIKQVATEITKYLKSTDRMSKTIVFCANEEHAERMRIELNNLNSDIARDHPDYVVRITGSDVYGKDQLDYFISVSQKFPVIATTSKLLSTGVDCKMVKLIVLDQMINSMTEFKQRIGRGTRIREKYGKTYFTVMDFRGVSRLFADPEWDGPIEIDTNYNPEKVLLPSKEKPTGIIPNGPKPYVDENGCTVYVINKTISIYDADNKLLKQEKIIDYTKTNIIGEYATLDSFINDWSSKKKKEILQDLFNKRGIDLDQLKKEQDMSNVDDFDFICHVAFNKKPLTRKERADNVKKRDFLSKYSDEAKGVLETLLNKYMDNGICEVENTEILKIDPLNKLGSPSKIVSFFGGKDEYAKAIKELEHELYKAA